MGTSVEGRRILVVGASSGIGAAFAKAAVGEGASVTVSARRKEQLEAVVEAAGGGFVAVGDAASATDMAAVAQQANEMMGGIDLVLYAAGYGVLQALADTDADTWTNVYRVNVIGANLATAACLQYLDSAGVVAFLSSRTVLDSNAFFTSYSASKAALDQCIKAWRVEHPGRRFTRIVMGNCQPTEFANQMGFDLMGDALEAWEKQAIPGGMMHVDDVGLALVRALAVSLDHPDIDASELQFDARRATD